MRYNTFKELFTSFIATGKDYLGKEDLYKLLTQCSKKLFNIHVGNVTLSLEWDKSSTYTTTTFTTDKKVRGNAKPWSYLSVYATKQNKKVDTKKLCAKIRFDTDFHSQIQARCELICVKKNKYIIGTNIMKFVIILLDILQVNSVLHDDSRVIKKLLLNDKLVTREMSLRLLNLFTVNDNGKPQTWYERQFGFKCAEFENRVISPGAGFVDFTLTQHPKERDEAAEYLQQIKIFDYLKQVVISPHKRALKTLLNNVVLPNQQQLSEDTTIREFFSLLDSRRKAITPIVIDDSQTTINFYFYFFIAPFPWDGGPECFEWGRPYFNRQYAANYFDQKYAQKGVCKQAWLEAFANIAMIGRNIIFYRTVKRVLEPINVITSEPQPKRRRRILQPSNNNNSVVIPKHVLLNNKFLLAVYNGNFNMVTVLLHVAENKIINKKLEDGATALYVAAQNGHLEIVEYLLQQGASLKKRKDMVSPMDVAMFLSLYYKNLNLHVLSKKYRSIVNKIGAKFAQPTNYLVDNYAKNRIKFSPGNAAFKIDLVIASRLTGHNLQLVFDRGNELIEAQQQLSIISPILCAFPQSVDVFSRFISRLRAKDLLGVLGVMDNSSNSYIKNAADSMIDCIRNTNYKMATAISMLESRVMLNKITQLVPLYSDFIAALLDVLEVKLNEVIEENYAAKCRESYSKLQLVDGTQSKLCEDIWSKECYLLSANELVQLKGFAKIFWDAHGTNTVKLLTNNSKFTILKGARITYHFFPPCTLMPAAKYMKMLRFIAKRQQLYRDKQEDYRAQRITEEFMRNVDPAAFEKYTKGIMLDENSPQLLQFFHGELFSYQYNTKTSLVAVDSGCSQRLYEAEHMLQNSPFIKKHCKQSDGSSLPVMF